MALANGQRVRRVVNLLCLLILLIASFNSTFTIRADESGLSTSFCALINLQVICYDNQLRRAIPVTPPDQQVIDFAMSPDGEWLIYRTAAALLMASIGGQTGQIVDSQSAPPAAIAPDNTTLTWSADGIGIAYLTAAGLRIAYPGGHFVDAVDRPYVNLKWSPHGGRLAAQSADGTWIFFETKRDAPLHITRVFAQASDIAWLTEDAAIIAPVAGGLLRSDVTNATAPPAWYVADEHFIKLNSTPDGQIVALHPDPGDVIGNSVIINGDGKWSALGSTKLDSRLAWGPPPGDRLFYITSGTPILVDRVTGAEDMIPIRRVTRITWGPLPLPEAEGVALDADLYFLSPDSRNIVQLWRLPRTGFPLFAITQSAVSVSSYVLYPDTIRYIAGGVAVTINMDGSALLPAIATVDLNPTPTKLPVSPPPPAGEVQSVGWQPGPLVVQRVLKTGSVSAAYTIDGAVLSPTGKFAVGFKGLVPNRRLVILDWTNGRAVTIGSLINAQSVTALRWMP